MPAGSPDPACASRPGDLLTALLLALAAVLLYLPTLGYDFTGWDDPPYVLTNPLTRSLDPDSIGRIFSHFYEANYFPLNLIAYAMLRSVAGQAPWAYHALNVGLHALCAALGFLLLRKLPLPRSAAALGASVFLAHPAQVEVVAWVSQTKTLLATAFGMGSLLALLRYRDEGRADGGMWTYGASLLLFVAAMLSKPQAIAFPGVFFCMERVVPPRSSRLPLLLWIPFVGLAAAGAWVSVAAQASAGAVKAYGPMGVVGQLLGSLVLLVRYLRVALLPVNLSIVYEMSPVRSATEARVVGAALLLLAVTAVVWRLRKSPLRPWLALGAFSAPLVPVLGWIPLAIPMADRYLYLPLLAFGWIVAGLSLRVPPGVRVTFWIVPALLAALSLARMPAWRDAGALWDTAVRQHPTSPHAWIGRGSRQFDAGDAAAAERDFRRAIALDGRSLDAWTNLGLALNRQGRFEEAVQTWRRALAIDPRADWPRLLIARDMTRRGDPRGALGLYDAVIRERTEFAMAHLYRAAARQRMGDLEGALSDLERAVALDPLFTNAQAALGNLRDQRGDRVGAIRAYHEALTYAPEESPTIDRIRERLRALEAGP